MKVSKRFALAVVGLSAAGTLFGAGVATADPSAPPANAYERPLQGVGSDTTDLLMNGLAEAVVGDHDGNPATPDQKLIASWDAKSALGFKSRAVGCDYTGNPTPDSAYVVGTRPNGSGNGQKALRDAFTPATAVENCLDFSRSSSNPSAGNLGGVEVQAVQLATDSLGFAVNRATSIPRQLSRQNLYDIYHCTFGGFTGATPARKALIPQAGSGTRSSWLGMVGLTEADLAVTGALPCVSDQVDGSARGGGSPLQEHDLRFLKTNQIAPVSVAQWISQMGGSAPSDQRGPSMLGSIIQTNGIVAHPMELSASFGPAETITQGAASKLTRTVYNAVPTKRGDAAHTAVNNPLATLVFVDTDPGAANTSLICQRADVIKKFGFAPISTCGTGSIINPQ
ncbi:hypothetical protein [Nocardioides cavernaquae]|uniref:PBP domain-containing protein n=1 Tax=Nocardioides cavernaquae TaxID=2321396 RepID=A0A3A5H871_9ACTN|nr:hypothetical protein [Nocardioides cavernaquae]RJS46191.1 hypothetical protein D4739_08210 [Nocardioides cavernaquae]